MTVTAFISEAPARTASLAQRLIDRVELALHQFVAFDAQAAALAASAMRIEYFGIRRASAALPAA